LQHFKYYAIFYSLHKKVLRNSHLQLDTHKEKLMAGKFEIKVGKTGKFRFNLKASNGQIILSSEAYDSRSSATKGIASVKKNAQNDKRFERKTAKDGSSYFVMKAANGEPIGKSEMYKTTKAMESGIASVRKNAPDAPVADGDVKPMAKAASTSTGGSISKMAVKAKKPAAKKPAAKKPAAKKAAKPAAKKAAVKKPAAKKPAAKKPAAKKAAPKKAAAKKATKPAAKKAAPKKPAAKKAPAKKPAAKKK
jgi:uncharacterized protein YegP (UPF0339 family)